MNSKLIKERIIIDKNSPIPLYYQFKTGLLALINEGFFGEDGKIPTELEFTNNLDISRPTVRQALNELIHEGCIIRLKAKGTFIKKKTIGSKFFSEVLSFDNEMKSLGLKPKTKIISCEVVKNHLPEIFGEYVDSLLKLERIRSASGKKIVFVTSYLPMGLFNNKVPDFQISSLYEMLTKFGFEVANVNREFSAVNADKKLADHLDIKPKDAMLSVYTKAYDGKDLLIEYSIAYYNPDMTFKINLDKNR